jgi:hypothetical protein
VWPRLIFSSTQLLLESMYVASTIRAGPADQEWPEFDLSHGSGCLVVRLTRIVCAICKFPEQSSDPCAVLLGRTGRKADALGEPLPADMWRN